MNILDRIKNNESLVLVTTDNNFNLKNVYNNFNDMRNENLYSIYLDVNNFSKSYTGEKFWVNIIRSSSITFEASKKIEVKMFTKINERLESRFNLFDVEKYFQLIGNQGLRIVLFLDHINMVFEKLEEAELKTILFGTRHFTSLTSGFIVITTSELSISSLNSRSLFLNQSGSPFFNTFQEMYT